MIEVEPQEQDPKEVFANKLEAVTKDKYSFTFNDAEQLKNMVLVMQESFPTDDQKLNVLLSNISSRANKIKEYFEDEETEKMYGTNKINEIGDKFSLKHFAKYFGVIL